ncbi:Carboxylesterase NlhH [Maioricimonas rarisocia]|uniref:Carboxylesterase NlhH n=1 Tax=Maioricimonas rarisocia TaxID=2528026 RepID=A0A517Z795_9PLAN|nr:alpha/beta hydrolase [Maioricimonas rarisocia]QDU38357.1 Carboxylesterase NlhH [Maioricimonas rarisocia]
MQLVPEAVQFLESQKGGGLVSSLTFTLDDARNQIPLLPGPPEPVAEVHDEEIPGPAGPLTIRCYRCESAKQGSPLTVFFHGGGWVLGSLDTHDPIARRLCNATEGTVLSVDYRLAPEHRWPAAPEDCYAAVQWAAANAETRFETEPSRLVVAGDSAGGNLATIVCLMARERGGVMPAYQGLIYPITDCDLDTASYLEHGEGKSLTRKMMRWFWDQYVDDADDRLHPHASPLRADDLSGLPPAWVMVAEHDPLRDEGVAYADRLEEAGVPVERVQFDGLIHGFVRRLDVFPQAGEAIGKLAQAIRSAVVSA